VFPFKTKYVVIAGNMRLKAMQESGYTECPCKVLSKNTPPEKLRAYTIKDNVGYGSDDWDSLANEWDTKELENWGMDIPDWGGEELEAQEDDYDAPPIDEVKTDIVLGDLFEIGE